MLGRLARLHQLLCDEAGRRAAPQSPEPGGPHRSEQSGPGLERRGPISTNNGLTNRCTGSDRGASSSAPMATCSMMTCRSAGSTGCSRSWRVRRSIVFQVLTKWPERMRDYCRSPASLGRIATLNAQWIAGVDGVSIRIKHHADGMPGFHLPNVWLGVSVEDQTRADERIPPLLDTPVAVRFVSCEPLLGPIDLTDVTAATAAACRAMGLSRPHRCR